VIRHFPPARPPSPGAHAAPARRARRVPRRTGGTMAALLVIGLIALLTQTAGVTATATPAARASAAADTSCTGVTPGFISPAGFITNSDRTQGGHLWWRGSPSGGTCIGSVIEWVQYNTTMTKTWRVIIYSAGHPGGQVVAQQTFTLGRGWYWWSFGVHQVFTGLTAVCLTATDSFGTACLDFGQPHT
jgi:hypothetical protein